MPARPGRACTARAAAARSGTIRSGWGSPARRGRLASASVRHLQSMPLPGAAPVSKSTYEVTYSGVPSQRRPPRAVGKRIAESRRSQRRVDHQSGNQPCSGNAIRRSSSISRPRSAAERSLCSSCSAARAVAAAWAWSARPGSVATTTLARRSVGSGSRTTSPRACSSSTRATTWLGSRRSSSASSRCDGRRAARGEREHRVRPHAQAVLGQRGVAGSERERVGASEQEAEVVEELSSGRPRRRGLPLGSSRRCS